MVQRLSPKRQETSLALSVECHLWGQSSLNNEVLRQCVQFCHYQHTLAWQGSMLPALCLYSQAICCLCVLCAVELRTFARILAGIFRSNFAEQF